MAKVFAVLPVAMVPKLRSEIMSCQVFAGEAGVTLDAEARAIKYAADNGAVILQCSWGYNSSLANLIEGYTPGPGSEEEWEKLYPLEKMHWTTLSIMPVRPMG